jgi:putative ABC transport system permease protein
MGDLQEDYARRREAAGAFGAWIWLFREVRSLIQAYRAAAAEGRAQQSGRARLMLSADVRHAWQRLAARPTTAILCATLLSLGIGLSTAMFSVVDSLLIQPVPFHDAERLVRQTLFRPEPLVMEEWRASGMFERVEAARLARVDVQSEDGRRWRGAWITPGTLDLLGVRPKYGRSLSPPAQNAVAEVLLSDTIWSAAFGRDRAVLGRRIRLGDVPAIVVGIMPADFHFPEPATVAWAAFLPSTSDSGPVTILGRLRPRIPIADAEARTAAIARRSAYIPKNYRHGTGAPPFLRIEDMPLGSFTQRALWLLFAGVALVFLVLCANVSSLLLARLTSRRREFGVCAALGAARGRLLRQVLAEHVLIGAAGASAGVGLAWLLVSKVPDAFLGQTLNPIDIDLRAMAAATAVGIAAVIGSGLLPAWLGTRGDPMESLRRSGQSGSEPPGRRLFGGALVAAETALACALLAGSAFLVQSFVNLVHADRGLDTAGVIHLRLDLERIADVDPVRAKTARDETLRYVQTARGLALSSVEAALSSWRSIRSVAFSQELPPVTGGGRGNVRVNDEDAWIESDGYRVGASFFDVYGIRILRGRGFGPGDSDADIVVGERLAKLLWSGQDPIGRILAIGLDKGRRVIGVAAEISLPTLDASLDRPEFYQPLERHADDVYVSVRCSGTCPDDAAFRARIASVHPALGVRLVTAWDNQYLQHLRLPRATAQVGGLFAAVAVLTAAGGLFSLLTYVVGQRRREFGIRTALGASPRQMARLVFRSAAVVVFVGVAAGALGGWFVARALAAFQYGVTTEDPVIWTGVLGTIALVSIVAAWRPAREAMRVDPVRLLREE